RNVQIPTVLVAENQFGQPVGKRKQLIAIDSQIETGSPAEISSEDRRSSDRCLHAIVGKVARIRQDRAGARRRRRGQEQDLPVYPVVVVAKVEPDAVVQDMGLQTNLCLTLPFRLDRLIPKVAGQ